MLRIWRKRKARRAGAAAVEMALVTPLLVTMLFGIIEYGWLFSVRQALIASAREGARTATLPGSTRSEVQARVDAYMQPLGLTGYTTTIATDPNDPNAPSGTVAMSIPYTQVSLLGHYFGHTSGDITTTATMRKEGS